MIVLGTILGLYCCFAYYNHFGYLQDFFSFFSKSYFLGIVLSFSVFVLSPITYPLSWVIAYLVYNDEPSS